ncbi:hypothetical protein HKX48_004874 [Thoreauomyces humboldtii]|nr:hypothetical protein HKX48_004874 [Thoreauomyces humboldtii]
MSEDEQSGRSRPVGGLMNIMLQRGRNRPRGGASSNALHPNGQNNSGRSQADTQGIDALEGLDASKEEVYVTARKQSTPWRWLIPHPFTNKVTGLSLVRSNYMIRHSNTRKSGNPDGTPFRILDVRFHAVSYLRMLKQITDAHTFAITFVYLDLFVDVILCFMYIWQMSVGSPYSRSPQWLWIDRPLWLYRVILACGFYNAISLLGRIAFTGEKRRAILSTDPLVDLVTTVPLIVSLFLVDGQFLYVPYFLRCWYIIWRSNRAMSVNANLDADSNSVQINPLRHQLIVLLSQILAILFTGMCCFQWSEMMFSSQIYTALDVFYFSLVTASTIGYGDIEPSHWVSRVIVIVLIFVVLGLIPGLISDFLDTWSLNKESSKSFVSGTKEHLILVGNFSDPNRVQDLLNGFLDLRNESDPKIHLVLMGPNAAPLAVQSLLALPFYKAHTTYLQGACLDERDFERMKARGATAAFMLSNRRAKSWFDEDCHTTLCAWSFHIANPKIPLYTEVLLPETAAFQQMTEAVVCVDEIKQVLLAYNCLHKGASTVILNLIFQSNPSNNCERPWEYQYSDGLANEIYIAPVNEVFIGRPFAWLSWYLFVEFQVVLFAVKPQPQPTEDGKPGTSTMLLNPGKTYKMARQDQCYYIAHHTSDIKRISKKFSKDQIDRSLRQYDKDEASPDVTVDIEQESAKEIAEDERREEDRPMDGKAERRRTDSTSKDGTRPHVSGGRPQAEKRTYSLQNASDDDDEFVGDAANEAKPRRRSSEATEKGEKQPEITTEAPTDSSRGRGSADPLIGIAESEEDTILGRPESPYTATQEDAPPLCHLLKKPRATVADCLLSSATHFRGHIVVCAGQQPLFRFMCTMRSASQGAGMRQIVVLGVDEPTEEEFRHTLAVFPRVYYVVGDCRRRADMLRAGAKYARTILVMSKPESFGGGEKRAGPNPAETHEVTASVADSAAVMTTHVVHQIMASSGVSVNDVRPLTDDENEDNDGEKQGVVGPVKQLHENANDSDDDGHAPSHRKTTVITEILDRKSIRFLHALECSTAVIDHLHSPVYAAGQTLLSSLLDCFIFAIYQNRDTLPIVKALCGDLAAAAEQASSPGLALVPLPKELAGKTFADVFRSLTEATDKPAIPIAMLREPCDKLGNELPFVYTNPVPSLIVREHDRLYVLRSPQPDDQKNKKSGKKDKEKTFKGKGTSS